MKGTIFAQLKTMKQFIFFFLITTSIIAQGFSKIQEKTNTYSEILTAEQLAKNITRDFSSDEDKVKALYCWITKNIRYDLEEFYNPNRKRTYRIRYRTPEELVKLQQERKDSLVNQTLLKRKAVCQGYADVFAKVCTLLNIENDLVKGNVRFSVMDINQIPQQTNHVWNVVKLNNKWIFIDTTWGTGFVINGKWQRKFNPYFYDMPSSSFFKTHYPDNAKWRLRIGRISKEDFYRQPIIYTDFLTSNIEIINKNSGTLVRSGYGEVKFQLKNLNNSQKVFIGFHGKRIAQQPEVNRNNGITSISTTVPNGVGFLSVIIDGKTFADFVIQ